MPQPSEEIKATLEDVPNVPAEKLDHPLSLRILLPIVKAIAWSICAFYGAIIRRPKHKSNIPKQGPLLIFSNHISNTDPILIQISCSRLINFMARRELFIMPHIAWLIKWFRAFPVTQSSSDLGAIKTSLKLLKGDHAVCVFPEGRLSPNAKLLPLFPGIAMLARKSGVPCICVGLQGTNHLMPYGTEHPHRTKANLIANWGTPKTFDRKATPEDILQWVESELRQLTNQPKTASEDSTPEAIPSESQLSN